MAFRNLHMTCINQVVFIDRAAGDRDFAEMLTADETIECAQAVTSVCEGRLEIGDLNL